MGLADAPADGATATPRGGGGAVVLEARELTKTYPGGVTAVDRLNLSVSRGEIFGLLGPNGAGKTTTLGMFTTRVTPTTGRALIAGVNVVTKPELARRFIGVLPQTNTLDRSLTVRENLYFHARYFGMRPRAAHAASDEALQRFRLANRAKAQVVALSGGMAQRLMLARAVLHCPEVLFLDEPTTRLDPQSRLALWELIGELQARDATIVLTTHQMEEADRLCDRVAIMDHGRILAVDTPPALKRSVNLGTAVTVRGRGNLNRLAEELAGVAGATQVTRDEGFVRLQLGTGEAALDLVIAAAGRSGVTLTDVSAVAPTLETVFIHLTGKGLRE